MEVEDQEYQKVMRKVTFPKIIESKKVEEREYSILLCISFR